MSISPLASHFALAAFLLAGSGFESVGSAAEANNSFIWIEGESAPKHTMNRHPWWYDQVKKDELSGGDFISNFDEKRLGRATYTFDSPADAKKTLWVRANPVGTQLEFQLNGGNWTPVKMEGNALDQRNIAADDKIDLRFIAWMNAGEVPLKLGSNTILFKFDSENSHHGSLDCFVFAESSFLPNGKWKPGEMDSGSVVDSGEWFPFAPGRDEFNSASVIDLRSLNEDYAGQNGRIAAKDGRFVHESTGEPIRFWAVNGPSSDEPAVVKYEARLLAKYGVNLARLHHGYYNEEGELDQGKIDRAIQVVELLKAEGIYSHLSIYFPLWLKPGPQNPFLKGYDGTKNPFAALMFNPDFQKHYQTWWTVLLTTPIPGTGKRLIDEPALMGLELQNEDSFFFWTFNNTAIPETQFRILEQQFGKWAIAKHGTLTKALKLWGDSKTERDDLPGGRLGFRPLWNMANERTRRDQDTARFLYETQRGFYQSQIDHIRKLGYKGLITCSNWVTASPEVLGPIEKLSYTAGDFIDRHGYFGCQHKGDSAEWSVRNGHTYNARSYLKFQPEDQVESAGSGKRLQFEHPGMDLGYNNLPSMISETTWNRPNRFRSEAPMYFALYGALQGSDAIVHFAFDGGNWSVQPGYFMQPWTLCAPSQMGQFPAAAMIYRKGLIAEGATVANIALGESETLGLKGTPLPQGASFDELRLKDVPPEGRQPAAGQVLDPLVHYVGKTNVTFGNKTLLPKLAKLSDFINHQQKRITSTTKEIEWRYDQGVIRANAPQARIAMGDLAAAGPVALGDVTFTVDADLAVVCLVSLDDQPIESSRRMLLQVMTEEQPSGWRTEPLGGRAQRILDIGRSPWMVKQMKGTVSFAKGPVSKKAGPVIKVFPLDQQGLRQAAIATPDTGEVVAFDLLPSITYYLLETAN